METKKKKKVEKNAIFSTTKTPANVKKKFGGDEGLLKIIGMLR